MEISGTLGGDLWIRTPNEEMFWSYGLIGDFVWCGVWVDGEDGSYGVESYKKDLEKLEWR